ncbi:hypothetical protein [Herbiconiux daphne]|uniref:Uncharacterized protein n=1 Tax=Herbiconiux daphne TaxID=2970914 RepID=A0ABT2H9K7_9MICO|nr:hypothetical protein [Herbiconiux daphne]MCS5736635.1 hypothetical protein [Herbiconiux daphne]
MDHNVVKKEGIKHYFLAKDCLLKGAKLHEVVNQFNLDANELLGLMRELRAYRYLKAKYRETKWKVEYDAANDLKGIDFTVTCTKQKTAEYGKVITFGVSGLHDETVKYKNFVDYSLMVTETAIYQKKVKNAKIQN